MHGQSFEEAEGARNFEERVRVPGRGVGCGAAAFVGGRP
jgi:hypothetical protein